MDSYSYIFPALRGIQAGREYFVAMCPLRLIPRLFLFDEEDVPPELRAQRLLNKGRLPSLTRYLVENPRDYVFSAITASIDGAVEFQPVAEKGAFRHTGQLTIPMSARFVVNDGQHRRAAIEAALKERPELGDETLAVVFFSDAGLKRSQQLFADLNTHAVRPSPSIGILYDYRDPLACLARTLAETVPAFRGRTELERSTISNRSLKLFTLSGLYHATAALLHKSTQAVEEVSPPEAQLALDFWMELSRLIPEWQERILRSVTPAELRRDYVHVHSVALHAFGIAGADLIAVYPETWRTSLQALAKVDWLRSNSHLWEGRATVGGRMSKARVNVVRTATALKQILGLPLTADEVALEVTP